MKKFMRNFGIMMIALVAFTLSFSTVTLANDEDGKNPAPASEFKFIGELKSQPVFQLSINNKEEEEFTIVFRDETGNVLYTDVLKGANISKKYMFKSEDLSDGSLHVVVKLKNANKIESFSINKTSSYIESTTVQKIN